MDHIDDFLFEFLSSDIDMLPKELLEDMGFRAKKREAILLKVPPVNYFADKARSRSAFGPPISIELPKSRQKSTSLIKHNYLVSNPHGITCVQTEMVRY